MSKFKLKFSAPFAAIIVVGVCIHQPIANHNERAIASLLAGIPAIESLRDTLEDLPSDVIEAANKGAKEAGILVSDALFDQLRNIKLFKIPISDQVKIGVSIGRKVYNNHDLEESFTVVDRLQIPISLPGLTLPLGSEFFTFNVNSAGALDFANLRVVRASDPTTTQKFLEKIYDMTDLKQRQKAVNESEWLAEARKGFKETTGNFVEGPKDDSPVYLQDSLRRARYSKIWNMISAPLRLPLKAEWIDHIQPFEVVTYGGSGLVEFGPSAGVHYTLPDGKTSFNAGANIRAYLRGDFRIAIMRTGENSAKVKISRGNERGVKGHVGMPVRTNIYDGMLISGNIFGIRIRTTLGKISESIIPISFGAEQAWGDSFELGYEYHFSDVKAVEAYEQAVTGRFGLSEDLAQEGNSGVTNLFKQNSDMNRTGRNVGINLRLLEHRGQSTYTIQDAVITFPDSTSHAYKARTDVTFNRELDFIFWKAKEGVNYSIQSNFIEDLSNPQKEALLGLIAEGRITDNFTSGVELNRYSEMVEQLFGIEQLFPLVPITTSANKNILSFLHPTHYGRAEFFYRLGLTEKQILQLLMTPEEKIWEYLEIGFDRPKGFWTSGKTLKTVSAIGGLFYNFFEWLFKADHIDQRLGAKYVHASLFAKRWSKLQKTLLTMNPDPLHATLTREQKLNVSKLLGKMFSDKIFTYELSLATLLALRGMEDSKISYQINAQSSAFPTLNIKGADLTEVEKLTERYRKETEYDRPAPQVGISEMEVRHLKVKQLSTQQFEVSFQTKIRPPLLLIRLEVFQNFFGNYKTVEELLIPKEYTLQLFREGDNQFVIEPSYDILFTSQLSKAIKAGHNYRLTIAVLDERHSGPPQSVEFYAKSLD